MPKNPPSGSSVASVSGSASDSATASGPCRERPAIIELAGPAGAGKSTVADLLIARAGGRLRVETHPGPGTVAMKIFFLVNFLQMLPVWLRTYSGHEGRYISLREAAWMLLLNGWHRMLRRRAGREEGLLVLDQGPVFLLTVLRVLGPACLRTPGLGSWWKGLNRHWSATLGAVVYLDAPDSCLLERIRSRRKEHVIKHERDDEAVEFLTMYRTAYREVLAGLTGANPGLRVLSFDTDRVAPSEIADRVLKICCSFGHST